MSEDRSRAGSAGRGWTRWAVGLGAASVVAGAEMAGCVVSGDGVGSLPPGLDAGFVPFDATGSDAPLWFDGAVDARTADHSVDAPIDAPADVTTSGNDAGRDASDAGESDASDDDASLDAGVDATDDGDAGVDASDAAIDADDGAAPLATGCADGTREGFLSSIDYPAIAACAGAWSVPGVTGTLTPACGRQGGNGGPLPLGTGCSAADLCAAGWHVCATSAEVAAKSADAGCAPATVVGVPAQFFATGQSGAGNAMCGAGANDVFGCGNLGESPNADCTPLDRFSDNLCGILGPPWSCGSDGVNEAVNAVKTDSTAGGVMCCAD